jgi:hypothetical protein
MTTRKQAIEDLSMFGIKEPQTYLVDIIPLVEMISGRTGRYRKVNSRYSMNTCTSGYSKSMKWRVMQQ